MTKHAVVMEGSNRTCNGSKALEYSREMWHDRVEPNTVTFSAAIGA